MKITGLLISLVCFAIGSKGQNFTNNGFELSSPGAYTTATGVSGWTVQSQNNDGTCTYTNWAGGSSEFSLVATPITNWPYNGSPIGIIPHSPLGGTVVAQLNNSTANNKTTRLRKTFVVSPANALLQFAFAGYWQNGGSNHGCCQQSGFMFSITNANGNMEQCLSFSVIPMYCTSAGVTFTMNGADQWSNWQIRAIDLSPYNGTSITISYSSIDCSEGSHFGTTLIDVYLGGQNLGVCGLLPQPNPFPVCGWCPGSTVAYLSAPLGYSAYQWINPGHVLVPAPQGTMQSLAVQNPIANTVYTVMMMTATGCWFTQTLAVTSSQVGYAGIGSSPSCPNGASGSATVLGAGSSLGYSYSWKNAANIVVGTTSVVSGLSPGIYSVTLTGNIGYCGTSQATVEVAAQQNAPGFTFKTYCGNEAYLCAPSGASNIQWYQNTIAITSSSALPCYTVTSPCNGCNYWVAYNQQGCRDSLRFTLVATAPGSLTVPPTGIKPICPGATNGTATIIMNPALGTQPGNSSFSVTSTGATPPFSAGTGPPASNTYTVEGLSPGSYSVYAFDGACKYGTTFIVNPVVFNFSLTSANATLCPGQSKAAGATFSSNPSQGQYSYTWSPTNWLLGNNGNYQNTIITPTAIPAGSVVTTIYSVAVTPSIAFCPLTKTLSITAINPQTPTITPIMPLCNTFAAYQVSVDPGGGTFINATATPGLLNTVGVINPATAPIGISSFTYAVNIFTCTAKSTATFQVSTFKSAALTTTSAFVCTTDSALHLPAFALDTNSAGWTGPGISGSDFKPFLLPVSSYQLVHHNSSVPDANACPDSDTLQVTITNTFVPVVDSIPDLCNNFPSFIAQATPTGGTWQGSNVTSLGLITPSAFQQHGNYPLTYSVAQGGCEASVTKQLNIHEYRPAVLTAKKLDICVTAATMNLKSYLGSTGKGEWSGTHISGSDFDPSGLPTGWYSQVYTSFSYPGAMVCPHSDTLVISVLNPKQPAIVPAGPFCSNSPTIQLYVAPAEGQWEESTYINAMGVFQPSKAVPGPNLVQYTNGTPTCSAQHSLLVHVETFVPADLLPMPASVCKSESTIRLDDYVVNKGGVWSGPGTEANKFFPGMAQEGPNVLVYQTHSLPTPSLCPDERAVLIKVVALPDLSPVASANKGCAPLEVTFNVPNVNTGQVTWITGDGEKIEGEFAAGHAYQKPGSYEASMLYVLEGCSTKIGPFREITVLPAPEASFTVPRRVAVGGTVQPVNQTRPLADHHFTWKVEGHRDLYTDQPLLYLPDREGECSITLVATNGYGCRHEVVRSVMLSYDINIYIPNAFTPDFDKLNDTFKPVFSPNSIDLSSYRLEIFDRWGDLLFSTGEVNTGWDGLNSKTNTALMGGIYNYKITYVDRDGNPRKHTGYVNMIN